MVEIHPTAVIYDGATIGEGSSVGPYSVIGPHVVLGPENRVGSHVVIEGHTRTGARNVFFQFASVGAPPQDLKFKGEPSRLELGDDNVIREGVTLQPGTKGGGMLSKIGSKNLFMSCSHVAHDCSVGSGCVFANYVGLAGHVTVGDGVIFGGLCGIHQFVRLGSFSLIAAGAMVTKDVPPYCVVQGDRARLVGLNRVGLKRRGYSPQELLRLKTLYHEVMHGSAPLVERARYLETTIGDFPLGQSFLEFFQKSKRGILVARKARAGGSDDADAAEE